jgi:hypothetical protein
MLWPVAHSAGTSESELEGEAHLGLKSSTLLATRELVEVGSKPTLVLERMLWPL